MSPRIEGSCRGCGEVKKLIRAHIIPDTFCRLAKGSSSHLLQVCKGSGPPRQGGFRDSQILCAECDQKLGVLDKLAREWWRQALKQPFKSLLSKPEAKIILLPEININILKRFVASIFWRASISCHHEYSDFKLHVDESYLGRRLICESIDTDFPGVELVLERIHAPYVDFEIDAIYSNPVVKRERGLTMYSLLLCGFYIHMYVVPIYPPRYMSSAVLLNGKYNLSVVMPFEDTNLFDTVRDFLDETKLPKSLKDLAID